MSIIHVPVTKRPGDFHVLPQVLHTRLDDARKSPAQAVPQHWSPFPAAETP